MNGFFLNLLVSAVKNPDIRAFLLEVAERMGKVLLPGLSSIIPAAFAAGVKLLSDHNPGLNLPGLPDLTKAIHDGVNAMLPDDVDIPFISDAFEKVTGFDLSDILTGRQK